MNYRKVLWNRFYSEVIATLLTMDTPICVKQLERFIKTSKQKFETEDVHSLEEFTSSMILKYKL